MEKQMSFAGNGPGEMTLGPDDRAAAVAEVKAALRVTRALDDDLIAAFAEAALGIAEQFTGRVLVRRDLVETLDGARAWRMLGAVPVRSIMRVSAVDAAGGTIPVAVDGYAIDVDAGGRGWVRVAGGGRIAVGYAAGDAEAWSAIPAPIRQGTVLLAAHLYESRDAATPPPTAVTALWRPYRTMRLQPKGQQEGHLC